MMKGRLLVGAPSSFVQVRRSLNPSCAQLLATGPDGVETTHRREMSSPQCGFSADLLLSGAQHEWRSAVTETQRRCRNVELRKFTLDSSLIRSDIQSSLFRADNRNELLVNDIRGHARPEATVGRNSGPRFGHRNRRVHGAFTSKNMENNVMLAIPTTPTPRLFQAILQQMICRHSGVLVPRADASPVLLDRTGQLNSFHDPDYLRSAAPQHGWEHDPSLPQVFPEPDGVGLRDIMAGFGQLRSELDASKARTSELKGENSEQRVEG